MREFLSEELLMGGEEHFEPITFSTNSELQTWTVPAGIRKIHIDCVASQGCASGGLGGRVECDLIVTPKQTLYIMVGKIPDTRYLPSYNASDIRIGGTEYDDRIIVAGGGGSSGSGSSGTSGANGGGEIGATANNTGCSGGGQGGTQDAGGTGGRDIPWTSQNVTGGATGEFGLGGRAYSNSSATGGAGGAGWYGGGGGAAGQTKKAGTYGAGGGGGSSFADADLCLNVVHTQGFRSGAGYVTISMIEK